MCFAEGEKVRVTEEDLRTALTVRTRRRVRRDSTVTVGGTVYEVSVGYLAGELVVVATSLFDSADPALEVEGKRIPLAVVDPIANGKKRRPPRRPTPERAAGPVDFDPARTLEDLETEEEEADDGDLV